MDKSLIDYLKQIPDHRSPHGLRHPLWLVLLSIIMGMMSGYWVIDNSDFSRHL